MLIHFLEKEKQKRKKMKEKQRGLEKDLTELTTALANAFRDRSPERGSTSAGGNSADMEEEFSDLNRPKSARRRR